MYRRFCVTSLFLLTGGAGAFEQQANQNKVMIWVANPNNQTKLDAMIADLKVHRNAITGIAYQFFAICGEGSDDEGGCKDCMAADATGEPHLAPGHPINVPADLGSQLKSALGDDIELWPVISYGNPGNASVLNRLLTSPGNIAKFAADAVEIAHAQGLTGYNLDLETAGMVDVNPLLNELARALHSAAPPIGISYDGGNTPPEGSSVAPVDRWISMATYTSSESDFESGVLQGLNVSGEKFGVGLCPSCDPLNEAAVQQRFDFIKEVDAEGKMQEVDVWAYGAWPDFWWTAFEHWLAKPRDVSTLLV